MVGDRVPVQVDGGVNAETIVDCAEAGASWFVAGSAIFGSDDPVETFLALAEAAGAVLAIP
jgi:ribulose-phosphate 3-epimerase